MPTEFDIIRQYFIRENNRDDIVLGIGDDASITEIPQTKQLVQSIDTLVAGVHFPESASAADIAYKALAVNLSDMAAMGATPAWFTLAITLPDPDKNWLKEFSDSLSLLANEYNIALIGGDTTRGPLSVSVSISGLVDKGAGLTRSNAQPGDLVYVTGTLGDAALALTAVQGDSLLIEDDENYLLSRLNRPTPRLDVSEQIRNYVNACIDISDGLIADLGHIIEASQVGAKIYFDKIPCSEAFKRNITDSQLAAGLMLSGGDDYELCFTVAASKQNEFNSYIAENNLQVTCIGEIIKEPILQCFDGTNTEMELREAGYQHFS